MFKVLFCSKQYKETPNYLKKFLDISKYEITNCDPDNIVNEIIDAAVVVPLMSRINTQLIESAKNLKLIQQFGVGLEGVDIEAATKKQVYVANVPANDTGNAYSVSELTLFLILGLLKDYNRCIDSFKKQVIGYPVGDTLINKKFLVLGYGNVGKAVVAFLSKLGVDITVARRKIADNISNIHFITLDNVAEVVHDFDFLIVTLALNKDTKDFVNEDIIFNMKKNSFIINVARGGVVKYSALLKALKEGIIKGAGLDVFWDEPFNPKDEILRCNVIVTPHIAGSTFYSYDLISKKMAENIIKVIEKGLPPDNWANRF